MAKEADIALFCYEGDGTVSLRTLLTKKHASVTPTEPLREISLVIGSEGGCSEREAADAKDAGLALCGLGRRILRCESASGFALACISYEFEL